MRPKRANAGSRLKELIEKNSEDIKEIDKYGGFKEVENDDEFCVQNESSDTTETESDSESEEDELKEEHTEEQEPTKRKTRTFLSKSFRARSNLINRRKSNSSGTRPSWIPKNARIPSQARLLAEAKKTEKINTQLLLEFPKFETPRSKYSRHRQNTLLPHTRFISSLKLEPDMELSDQPFFTGCRNLIMYSSACKDEPYTFSTPTTIIPNRSKHRYRDPITGTYFNTVSEFMSIRNRTKMIP